MTETNGAKTFGLFVGILVVCVALLFGFTRLTRLSWQNSLSSQVQTVLDISYPGEYRVDAFVPLRSTLASSSAVFELLTDADAEPEQKQYGIILKVPTAFGPLPGVFVSDESGIIRFAGFAFHFARFEPTFSKSLFYPRIRELEQRVQTLLEEINER
jgi:hypothetical protein